MVGASNIIVLVVDAVRGDHVTPEYAPTFTSLAASGVNCSNAFSSINATEPLLTSFVTGMYPRSSGLINHGSNVTKLERDLVRQVPFLQERLRANGYQTIAIDWLGGWHQRGFGYYSGEIRNQERRPTSGQAQRAPPLVDSFLRGVTKRCPPSVYAWLRAVKLKVKPPTIEPRGWLPDPAEVVTDEAIKRIDLAEESFYLFAHYWDTHVPYEVPDEYAERFGDIHNPAARYAGGIAYVDDQIRRLLDALEDRDILDETLVIVMADHGESLGEHGIYYDHHGLYDQSIHVPIVLSHPDLPSVDIDAFVQHVDLAPTILDFLGYDIPEGMDGQSLLPVIEGVAQTRSAIVAEEAQTQRKICIRTDRYKYIQSLDDDPVCSGCHVIHGGPEELYDLKEDPGETRNLVGERLSVRDTLRDRLDEWRRRHASERAAVKQAVSSLLDADRF